MHELSVATSILEAVEAEAAKRPGAQFKAVGLRIGEVSGVDVDALAFGWEVITKDTAWESLKLDVERLPRKNLCTECFHEFVVNDYEIRCPKCGSAATRGIGGDELDIAYLELEEAEA